ncbi:MAG: cytochrome [Mucilaginibacter sp.]|nr:cytochrome [Mucilaginibacter sp.]
MIKSSHKGIAGNLLFAFNIFIVILLLAGNHLVIPRWLQPVGRLHPLILHFPIVILMIAMLLEFFRFRSAFIAEKFYQEFTTTLLLAGAIFSAITAIMGLFLSRESGYDGSDIQWHKWFGVSIVFISTFIYWLRTNTWYNSVMARSGSVIIVLFLLLAGHYGANITHGDNFVLAPVMQNTRPLVPIDQALVYRDLVQPIFENKCMGCHNPDKLKGGLMLVDEKSILKGGKTGKLFVPGQPQISLLLQRIHLPEEEKKHMPPSGKTQLTPAEMNVLYLWIKENADFKKKVTDLPADDSLRIIASLFLKPAETPEEHYDFAAADEKVVKKLNNNYCGVYPLAEGSPALAVDVYNKSAYSPKILEGLNEIKKQVVSLDLHKLPVKDAELKTIAKFENLRTLDLNFTDITGNSLKDLASLKYLRSLSLAGTKLNPQALSQLHSFKNLKELSIWNTGLTTAEVQSLKSANKNITIIEGFKDDGKPMKLIPPQIKNTAFVFTKPIPLLMGHPIKGVNMRYTTDGTDPDSIKSPLYQPGVLISANTTVKAKAYKAGWYGSDIVSYTFYKNTFKPDSIALLTQVSELYQADGAKTLIDGELGGMNFGNNKWLAAQADIGVVLFFKDPVKPRILTLDCLKVPGAQIFLPTEIQVWGGKDQQHLKLISVLRPSGPKKDDPPLIIGLNCKLNETNPINCIKIVASPIKKLPKWHSAKGKPSWVFMDEVFVN